MAAWFVEARAEDCTTEFFERRLMEVYSQFVGHGDTCIDVGVHKGDHLEAMHLLGAEVHGFEPCPTFQKLLQARGFKPVSDYALTSPGKVGRVGFSEDVDRPGYSGLQPVGSGLQRYHEVWAETLDNLFRLKHRPERIRFIKIDTEGHDVDVLEGASWTVATDQPIIACEWFSEGYIAHGRKAEDLYDWAEAMGYTVGDLWGNLCGSREEFLSVVDVSFWDWMLWPRWAVVAGIPRSLR